MADSREFRSKFLVTSVTFLGVLIAILVAIQFLGPVLNSAKLDFTKDKIFTISAPTKKILRGLKDDIIVRVLFERGRPQLPHEPEAGHDRHVPGAGGPLGWAVQVGGDRPRGEGPADRQGEGRGVLRRQGEEPDPEGACPEGELRGPLHGRGQEAEEDRRGDRRGAEKEGRDSRRPDETPLRRGLPAASRRGVRRDLHRRTSRSRASYQIPVEEHAPGRAAGRRTSSRPSRSSTSTSSPRSSPSPPDPEPRVRAGEQDPQADPGRQAEGRVLRRPQARDPRP